MSIVPMKTIYVPLGKEEEEVRGRRKVRKKREGEKRGRKRKKGERKTKKAGGRELVGGENYHTSIQF